MNALVVSRRAPARTFHTLDALRGVAALSVFLFHAAFLYGIGTPAEGQVAVDLFFVISGFIIAYRYDGELAAGLGTAVFMKRRLIRLFPLFMLGSLLGALPAFVATALGDDTPFHRGVLESLPLATAMLPSPFVFPVVGEVYPLNYVAWSLALEIVINFAYAVTFTTWTLPRLVGCVLVGFAALCLADWHYGTLNVGFAWAHYYGGFARVLYGFAAGVLIFRLFERYAFPRLLPWWILPPFVIGLFFFEPVGLKAVWELVLVVAVVPAIVVAAIATEPPRWAQAACAFAGLLSYVVYSLHAPLIPIFLRLSDRLHWDRASAPSMVAFSLLVACACCLAHVFFDKPVRARLTAAMARPRVRSPLLLLHR